MLLYIDPSAATYVIQAVAGAIIALGAIFAVFRHKISAFFKKNKKNEVKPEIHFNDNDTTPDTEKSDEDITE